MKLSLRSILPLILVIVFSFWTIKPLLHSGFFPMHDDTQPSRVYEMVKALSFGQFPVRWVDDLGYGYGYPLFNFYAPLPYYIGAIFNMVGFDVLAATKIMFAVGILLAGVTMFLLLSYLTDDVAAIVGSLLYMYAPYHAVDIYVRGAVGEFYALAFLPLVLLGVVKIVRYKQNKDLKGGIIIGSLGLAGVLLSHNILGMVTMYFLVAGLTVYLLYLLVNKKKFSMLHSPLSMILLGLGLSAFFILPAIFEKDFTRVNELTSGTNNFANHFVYPDQLWSSPWGFAGSAPGRADGMSFMIGKIHLLLGLLAVGSFLIFNNRKKLNNFQFFSQGLIGLWPTIFISMLILFLVSIFFMLEQSRFIWDVLPGFAFIQYPWRFLAFTVFSLSVMIPILLLLFKKNIQIIISAILIVLTIGFNTKYFIPKEYSDIDAANYISPLNLRFRISKISDEYLPKDFLIPKIPGEVGWQSFSESSNLRIINSFESPIHKIYTVDAIGMAKVETNITYFPGWQSFIDKKNAPMTTSRGRIELEIPAGRHKLEFILRDTPIRKAANAISILALFLLLYIIVLQKLAYARKKDS